MAEIDDPMLIGEHGLFLTEKETEKDPASRKIMLDHIARMDANRKAIAKDCQNLRDHTTHKGNTADGFGRMLGEIPSDIYWNNQHLFGMDVPPEEFKKNVRLFFQQFPEYRVGVL